MNPRKASGAAVLSLAILVGCQGGDASEPEEASTPYKALEAYGGDPHHPVLVVSDDPIARFAESELEMRVNAHRNALGLDALRIMPELKDLALAHSIHMGRHEPAFFDHRNPEGDLPEHRAERLLELGSFVSMGENIAAGQSAAEAVFRSWLDSPSHRANLEDPKWTHMGAGHAILPDSPYVTYWTLDLIER
ncbi:MAG TPA: CAP domain-containing protein [Gemmatimonadales bacterium]|nr:CAP domain-containing protein [Gemmatimonadales bacterium]